MVYPGDSRVCDSNCPSCVSSNGHCYRSEDFCGGSSEEPICPDDSNPVCATYQPPVPTPVQPPVPTPVQPPVPAPVQLPMPTPVQPPVDTPVQPPVDTPTLTPPVILAPGEVATLLSLLSAPSEATNSITGNLNAKSISMILQNGQSTTITLPCGGNSRRLQLAGVDSCCDRFCSL